MYSPGKALVVYEMSRHVCQQSTIVQTSIQDREITDLADSTITGHDTLLSDIH